MQVVAITGHKTLQMLKSDSIQILVTHQPRMSVL